MDITHLPPHITQSPEWGRFKTKMGTKSVRAGGAQFTLHKIPLVPYYIGYCPKVNPKEIDWEEIKKAGKEHRCAAIRFDCPNVLKQPPTAQIPPVSSTFLTPPNGVTICHAPRNTFAKHSVFLDITPSEEELLARMKPKTRYNIRYAKRHSITIEEKTDQEGLEIFLKLQRETAQRQGFLIHSNGYYHSLFETLKTRNMVHILIADAKDANAKNPLAAYMFFNYQKVLYYPYGGSSKEKRNLFPSNLLMWEAIRLGKKLGCRLFDMWGAVADENDPWWGFTRFKLGYGGELVEFIDSYDLVLNPLIYHPFNLAYGAFWKANEMLKKIRN